MSMDLTRRHVLESLSALGIFSLLPFSAAKADDLKRLGAKIDRAGLKRLADELRSQIQTDDASVPQGLEAIKAAVSADFANGRTVIVHNWQISETEARLVLLLAS